MFLVGVSSVEFSDCAQVDEDADSVVLEDGEFDEEGEDWTTTTATSAAKAEDLLREIVNYGLEQGRHLWSTNMILKQYCTECLIWSRIWVGLT